MATPTREAKVAKNSTLDLSSCFCLITGASQGLGKAIAKRIAEAVSDCQNSRIVIAARSREKLDVAKNEIETVSKVPIECWVGDVANYTAESTKEFLSKYSSASYRSALIVHNVGSLGDVSKDGIEHTCEKTITEYFTVNLASVIILNSAFYQHFRNCKIFVVNISSLCALEPFKAMSLYCAGKSAREMFFKCIASESPGISVLNYAPGPLDGDMQEKIRNTIKDERAREMFTEMKQNSSLVTFEESAETLIDILTTNSFKSGAHIDYFDQTT